MSVILREGSGETVVKLGLTASRGGAEIGASTSTPDHNVDEVNAMASPKSIKSPAFQFYPKDFLSSSKVQRMSYAEVGVYIILLSRCWLDDGLPGDVAALAKLIKIPARQFSMMWNGALGECFYLKSGRYRNDRLDEERKKQDAYRKRQTERAGKRWTRNAATDAMALQQTHSSGNALQSSSSSSSATTSKSERRAPIHDSSHRAHAHCGRVCIPAFLHSEFVRRWPVCPDPEMAARDWYLAIEREWADSPDALPEPKAFWQARFSERWPVAKARAVSPGDAWRPAEAM